MSNLHFSVIVTTSPGREENLRGCLLQLARQSHLPTEVLVIDDGSKDAQAICQSATRPFPVHYHGRPNDCCVSRSRNLGAARAQAEFWVFLDSDMLLNPHGLEAYAEYLQAFPEHILYGYFGYQPEYLAPSFLLPEREVMWCDRRFEEYSPEGLVPASNMIRFPHEWAWSGNFALSKAAYLEIGGFNEAYRGWGGEDLDFAWRLLQTGREIHFFLDAWAEHQVHSRTEGFHQTQGKQVYKHRYEAARYTPRVLYSELGWQRLRAIIFGHYLKTGRGLPAHPQSQTENSPLPESENERHG